MEDILLAILDAFEVPVFRHGSIAPDQAYPPTFFTIWETREEEVSAYDNETAFVVYEFRVNVYSNDPATAYSLLTQARSAIKAAGWQTPDRGHDEASDEITHIGRGLVCTYLETLDDEPTPEPEPEPTPEPTPEPDDSSQP